MLDEAALRNILLTLQADPTQYRNFGIWWWPLKAVLRSKFTQDQLKQLGPYEDEEIAALVPHYDSPEKMLAAALEEYALNVRYNLGSSVVQDIDGQAVVMYDEDFGF